MPLHSLEPQRLYRQIAGQLQALIESGEFPVGARLPAERELAVQLGVSRPSVREALIALEVEGWVEVRTGSGVYVLARQADTRKQAVPSSEWGPLELIRARRVVEGEIAAIAAVQARPADLTAMAQAIAAMQRDTDKGVLPMAGDRAFHLAIVQACGNAVLTETVLQFWDSRRGPLFERLGGYFETVASWRAAIGEHQEIYAAIVARDADRARRAMQEHMDQSHQRFSASWSEAQATPPKTRETAEQR
ncbi:FadR/GntR family transcriptional regulator [Variovorax sp. HJSM1_2]|uniref:FadR/GntR family transcriptional regulator n=1 Tax=Variovorax sp. HJSM1_2 TaxID=3366263 RepID=UPI003BE8C810